MVLKSRVTIIIEILDCYVKNKILLLGIGNAILGDDAVGIKIGEHFESLKLPIDVEYAGLTGLRILDYIQGYEIVIIVDALEINHENISDYKIRKFNLDEILDESIFYSAHDTSLGMALKLGKETLFDNFPRIINIIAVEIPYQNEFDSELSDHTKLLFKDAINDIHKILSNFGINN